MRIRPVLRVLSSPRRTFWENEHLKVQLTRALARADRIADELGETNSLLAQANDELSRTRNELLASGRKLAQRERSLDCAVEERDNLRLTLDEVTRFAPPGHYYSPIPSKKDIEFHLARPRTNSTAYGLLGIDLADSRQLELLEQLKTYYPLVPFRNNPSSGLLYHSDNPHYSYSDAVLLFCILNHFRPARLIEIGSGFSTCAILDTNRIFLNSQIQVTSIEPYPELLRTLLGKSQDQLNIVESRLQDADIHIFDQLHRGDVLFIDSTHVSKLGSDVNYMFFEVLPRLAVGVIVHLHDIYQDFEYPDLWLSGGRAWNESYMLRAFLEFNDSFRILLFLSQMQTAYRDWFHQYMSAATATGGGSFWTEKCK